MKGDSDAKNSFQAPGASLGISHVVGCTCKHNKYK